VPPYVCDQKCKAPRPPPCPPFVGNQNRIVEKATYWNLSKESGDAEEFFLKSGKFGPFFSMENPLYKLKSYFLGQNLIKFHQKQKNNDNISQPIQHMFIE
jgi:hypothetical protein